MPIISRRPITSNLSGNLSPLLQRIYSARGVTREQELNYTLKQLQHPSQLKSIDQAVDLLVNAIKQQQRVLIIGDFDADGATSCALSMLALRAMGLQYVDFLVPNRFEYGYGLTPEIVAVAAEKKPDLIVTVDNGIASIAGVSAANTLGIDVLITDHHLPGAQLPQAAAIINPNQPDCSFPSKNLAGVGVIFYVLSAVRSQLRERHWFLQQQISEPSMADFLDLVALGTVADVVPLDSNNRILVYQGLQRICAGKTRPGILALLHVAGKDYRRLRTQDLGFIIGPRLNAAGRLDDISIGIQCLLTDDADHAHQLAAELDSLNKDRRAIESSMKKEALTLVNELTLNEQQLPWGLSLFHETWHQGVVGIVASRIKEKYHRPVIAFAPADESGWIKGSARSIEGLHIRDTLDNLATRAPTLLQKFGGHAMAAGLAIKQEDYSAFSDLFDQVVREMLNEDQLQESILTDGCLDISELTLQTAHELQAAGPWGQQFPEPVFDGRFLLVNQRIVGEKHLKLAVAPVEYPQHIIDAIYFNADLQQWPDSAIDDVTLVYQLSVNEYRGMESVQLLVRHIQRNSEENSTH